MKKLPDLVENLERRVAALEAQVPTLVPISVLDIFANDPHRFSNRPCNTCATISMITGRRWGCMKEQSR